MNKKIALILATSIFGIFIFYFVLKLIGPGQLIDYIKGFSIFPFIAFMLISLCMMILSVYRWGTVIACDGYKVDFWNLFSYKISGFSMSYITPGAMVGGEAVRAYLLKRDGVPITKGISSILIDKFFDLSIAAVLTSMGLIIFISFFNMSNFMKAIISLVTVLWLLILCFFIYGALTQNGFFKHIFKALHLHKIKALQNIEKKIDEVEDHISRFFREHSAAFRRCIVISALLWFLMFVEFKLATAVFGYDVGLVGVFLIMCMVGLSYIFPVPGALGILEASMASIHTFFGAPAGHGLILSLLIRARDIIWTIIGMTITYVYGIDMIKEVSEDEGSGNKKHKK